MRSHTHTPPRCHARAPARSECEFGSSTELKLLVVELALMCLEGVAVGRSMILVQAAGASEPETLPAARWAEHASGSRELARRALAVVRRSET